MEVEEFRGGAVRPARRIIEAERARSAAEVLLDDVADFVRRFVVLSDVQRDAVVLWVVHTHVFDCFDATGYLLVTSPTARAGKTVALEVLECLVRMPWRPVDLTPAALFRTIGERKPTVLVDEVDALAESKALRAVLNSGYRAGAVVTRVETVMGMRMPVDFPTYSPKAPAGITGQRPPLHSTTLDRCIEIRLQRKLPSDPVERFLRSRVRAEAAPLQRRLEEFRLDRYDRLIDADPEVPEQLDDRAVECWWPLLAIAELAGGTWPKRARRAASELSGGRDDQYQGIALITDIHAVFATRNVSKISTNALLLGLRGLDEPEFDGIYHHMTGKNLANRLRAFGIRPHTDRFAPGEGPRRGYSETDFADAWVRYLA